MTTLMDTMTTDKKRIRRNHSPALKAQILAECDAPGASVAKVAMSHSINANIVHGWRRHAREQSVPAVVSPAFIPVSVAAATAVESKIHVELRRGSLTVNIAWPTSATSEMTNWMRELLR